MRLWLKDSERRPDPTPVRANERLAFIVGTAVWAVAFVVAMVTGAGEAWWPWAAVAGLAIGVLGLLNLIRARMKAGR